ncbi:MAG: helix-turn-helix domain-containing protein, partial [Ignavibacteriales bacterium]|nr:helix-turn-helix domain-containing protein [Ignavibacteriales bacterium]
YSKYGNFSNYIKTLRISEAIKIIKTPGENHKFSIEGIARSVGYFSRTAFIQAFKEHTGVTPSVFIRGWEKINDEDKKKHSVE